MTNVLPVLPTIAASFMASLVEFVEALTIVLAVGVTRGWRAALSGAAVALLLLGALVALLGQTLASLPMAYFQLVVGTLLLLFGMRWLSKAILRAAGRIPLHDETAAFSGEVSALRQSLARPRFGVDSVGFITAFKAVTLEGLEVVAIVIGIGAGAGGGLIRPAAAGALIALVLVIVLGLVLHRPLARVPENQLKFGVGVLLAAFGTFWVGEGIGGEWPGHDAILFVLAAGYLVLGVLLVALFRRLPGGAARRKSAVTPAGALLAILKEVWSLFIDDTWLAAGVLAAVIGGYVLGAANVVSATPLAMMLALALAVVLALNTAARARQL